MTMKNEKNANEEQATGIPFPQERVDLIFDSTILDDERIGDDDEVARKQQPLVQQIAVLNQPLNANSFILQNTNERVNKETISTRSGSLLDINSDFFVYAHKGGLIRVLLRRDSSKRILLRAHEGQTIVDIALSPATTGVLATVSTTCAILWLLQTTQDRSNVQAQQCLLIHHLPNLERLIWHPTNPNQFWLGHAIPQTNNNDSTSIWIQGASLVETTRLSTNQEPNPNASSNNPSDSMRTICNLASQSRALIHHGENIQIITQAHLNDLTWYAGNSDISLLLTGHEDGCIHLWNLQPSAPTSSSSNAFFQRVPHLVKTITTDDGPVTRLLFLPFATTTTTTATGDSFMTSAWMSCSKSNSTLTLWTPFSEQKLPTRHQTLTIKTNHSTGFHISLCFHPLALQKNNTDKKSFPVYILMANESNGNVLVISLTGGQILDRFQSITPFETLYPIFAWSMLCTSPQNNQHDTNNDDDDETTGFDIKMFTLQSKAIQQLTITHDMLASSTQFNPAFARGVSMGEPMYNDYDVEDDDEYDEEDDQDDDNEDDKELPQETASFLSNNDNKTAIGADNAFANWLGALASSNKSSTDPPSGSSIMAMMSGSNSTSTNTTPTPNALTSGISSPQPPAAPPSTPASGAMPISSLLGHMPPPGLLKLSSQQQQQQESTSSRLLRPMEFLSQSSSSLTPSKASLAPILPPPPPVAPPPPKPPTPPLPSLPGDKKKQSHLFHKTRSISPGANKSSGKKKKDNVANNAPTTKISILKRQDGPPPPTAQSDSAKTTAVQQQQVVPLAALEDTIKKVLAVQFKQQEGRIVTEVQRCVKNEFKTKMLPEWSKTTSQTMDQTVVRPLLKGLDQAVLKQQEQVQKQMEQQYQDQRLSTLAAITSGVEEPLNRGLTQAMKQVWIPAQEAATRQILTQVSDKLTIQQQQDDKLRDETITVLKGQVNQLTQLVSDLSRQMQRLEQELKNNNNLNNNNNNRGGLQAPIGSNSGLSSSLSSSSVYQARPLDPEQEMRQLVLTLLQQGDYEAAFTKALSSTTTEMVLFCCQKANMNQVLSASVLSQPLLLCLMQQLGINLFSSSSSSIADRGVEIQWLLDIALLLNPNDEQIHPHVPTVLKELESNLTQYIVHHPDASKQRSLNMLLHCIRGMQR